jgi:hypothetical protein
MNISLMALLKIQQYPCTDVGLCAEVRVLISLSSTNSKEFPLILRIAALGLHLANDVATRSSHFILGAR